MKALYDKDVDALTLVLSESQVVESDELKEGVIVDYDAQGRVCAIEILDASRFAPDPASIQWEVRPSAA